MKLIAVNGSPRKDWNTATLLEQVVAGAKSNGAEARLVHLYDYTYKGCISCFACKTINGKSYGACAVNDGLTALYTELRHVDALVLGSPIYFADVTGQMRCFVERLFFPYLVYDNPSYSQYPRKIQTAWVYTMGIPENLVTTIGYDRLFASNEDILRRIFGNARSLMSYDTLQFADYSRMVHKFDVANKQIRRREVFPEDCRKAGDLGKELTAVVSAEAT